MPSYPRIRRNPILTLRPFPEKTSRQSTSLAPAQKATGWISLGVWIMQCPMWEKARSGGGPRHMYFSCMVIWMNLIYSSQTGVFQFKGPFKIFTAICTFHNVLSCLKKTWPRTWSFWNRSCRMFYTGGGKVKRPRSVALACFGHFSWSSQSFWGFRNMPACIPQSIALLDFVGVCFGGACSSLISKFGGPS